MINREALVLLDTNVIIEAHRTGCWGGLSGRYCIATVEKCVEECDTGNQRRDNPVAVDTSALRKRIQVHQVTDKAMVELSLRYQGALDLDPGERELLALALTLSGAYFFCSPDKACVRAGHELGILNQFISLEELVEGAGIRVTLRRNFTRKWMADFRSDLLLGSL